MTPAREDVLARVRAALGAAPAVPEVPRDYRGAGEAVPHDPVARFAERVADYSATVHRVGADALPALVARLTAGERALAAAGVLDALLPWPGDPGTAPRRDDGTLGAAALDAFGAVVTGCRTAIAETGTIVLDGGERSGRRAITLIPDHHVCVVRSDQVVRSVPDAVAVLREVVAERRPITLVSGPSATSDIELVRVEGVHGPRRLDVVLVGVGPPR